MSTTHDLKTWPEFFDAVLDGRKTFEVRNTRDRDFAVGDVLRLREWTTGSGERPGAYTGREVMRTVSYIVRGAPFLPVDIAVLGLIDDADGASAEHWRAQYVKQVNLRHDRNAENDAKIAAVTAERDRALADAARWRREHESLRMDFAALVQKEMTLRGQTEFALCGRPVEDPVSKVVTLAARVASERAAAVKDGEAIRAAIGADLDASTKAVIARLSASRDDLMESGSRVAFLRRSGMEEARRMAATMCYEMQSKEADPVRGQAIRDVLTALATMDLGEVDGLARLPPGDPSGEENAS